MALGINVNGTQLRRRNRADSRMPVLSDAMRARTGLDNPSMTGRLTVF